MRNELFRALHAAKVGLELAAERKLLDLVGLFILGSRRVLEVSIQGSLPRAGVEVATAAELR